VSELAHAWPRTFGRYILLAPLAQGGMGEVCLALAGSVSGAERLCVVKTIRADLLGDPEFVGRFMDEGRVVCALNHPNLAQMLEVGIEQGTPFLAMEYVAGEDLDRVLQAARRREVQLSLDFVVTCVAAVLEGLEYAHAATSLDGRPLRLVHRDISPQNVRASWDGYVKVLDFGTARAAVRQVETAAGVVYGKPGYMAPEQARAETLDARTDLYALGIVAWELLAGAEMARRRTTKYMEAVAYGELKVPPLRGVRPELPPSVDAWIETMTRFERHARFADAAAARRALLQLAREHGARVDREVVIETLDRLLGREREEGKQQVTLLVARARALRTGSNPAVPASVPRVAQTGPMDAVSDAGVLPGTRYRLGVRLGAGGMGEVFAAEHADLGRAVALKVLYPQHSQNPAITRRFRMEARAIASLSHPNLVQVLDFGTTADGRLFYAMERLLGQTLRERIVSRGRLEPTEVVRIASQVARGLSAAHAVGLVHRDLKPENVFLVQDGGVKLLDFGVAKATDPSFLGKPYESNTVAGEIFGSPGYIAPEQGTGKPVDARTDIYTLGAVMYEALTGSRVFDGETLVEVLARHLCDVPEPMAQRAPDVAVPPELERLVMACLEKDPARRPQSALVLVEKLEAMLARLRGAGERGSAGDVPPRADVGRGARALLGGAVAVAVGAAGVALWSLRGPSAPVRTEAGGQALGAMAAGTEVRASVVARADAASAGALTSPVVVRADAAAPGEGVAEGSGADAGAAGVSALSREGARGGHEARRAGGADHYALAQEALSARRFDDAVSEAQAAISARQHAVEARNLLGLAYLRSGQREQAVAQWRMVLARDPRNAQARTYLRAAGVDPDAP
jgi:serine/threonine-protein kinase